MANGLFIPAFRGPGTPGAPGVGAVARGIQQTQLGGLQLQTGRDTARLASIVQGAQQLKQIRDPQQKIAFLEQRKIELQQAGLQTQDTDEGIALIQAGRFDELEEITDQAIALGQQTAAGFTLSPGQQRFTAGGEPIARVDIAGDKPVSAKEQAETSKLLAETDRIRAEQDKSRINDKERAETDKLRAQTDEIRQKISQGVGISATDTKVLEEERKSTVKANVKRIADLGQSSSSRTQAASKARRFLKLFQDGKVESGTTRRVAGFLPGVFTEQAAFDQEFDAFAEIAAREKLKAVGEIRPTDADVEGMKRALFGVNRDEATNIQLLTEFILEQEALDNELEDLRTAKKAGQLDVFTGGPLAPTGGQPPEPELEEGTIIVNRQTGQRQQVVNGILVDI